MLAVSWTTILCCTSPGAMATHSVRYWVILLSSSKEMVATVNYGFGRLGMIFKVETIIAM